MKMYRKTKEKKLLITMNDDDVLMILVWGKVFIKVNTVIKRISKELELGNKSNQTMALLFLSSNT